jgi:type IV pilus assembly protein PilA
MSHIPKRSDAGFTLVELLVVVIIVGVLATLAVPRYVTTRDQAFRTAAVSDLRNIATAQEAFWRMEGGYAPDVTTLRIETSRDVVLEITQSSLTGWAARAYHAAAPTDVCGVFQGDADPANGAPAVSAGEIRCGP